MSAALNVVRPGLFDTVQDFGRIGFMALGMPTAGAMDRIALSLANALVGNPLDTAGIEIGVMGPDLLVEADSVRIALVGPLQPSLIDGPDAPPKPLDSDRSHLLKRGQILRVGMIEGSSTGLSRHRGRPRLACFHGQPLDLQSCRHRRLRGPQARGGRLAPRSSATRPRAGDERKLGSAFDYGKGPIRIVWGPQDDYFSEKGRRTFVESEYKVSKEADRMGIRFEGPTIEHEKGADIISDGIAPGAIQVPAAGLPIVLLGDRQTVGGYSKIATVASVDLPRFGRLLPGQDRALRSRNRRGSRETPSRSGSAPAARRRGFQDRPPGGRHRPHAPL